MQKKTNVIVICFVLFCGLLACMGVPDVNDPQLAEFSRTILGCSTSHTPFSIDGNAALDAFPDKIGSGTRENPYIIENLEIDAGGGGNCIAIQNTTKWLVLRNCTLVGATAGLAAGIFLNGCVYTKITNCSIRNNTYGINLNDTWGITISSNNISRNVLDGISLESPIYANIYGNVIDNNNGTGVFLNSSIQSMVYNNAIRGNALGAIEEINSVGNKIFDNDCGGCDTLRQGEGLNVLLIVASIVIAVPLLATVVLYKVSEARKRKNREGKVAQGQGHPSEGKASDI
jgi:parallel beta-helix repeat protein